MSFTISVVIPTRDRVSEVQRALESVFSQTRPPNEIIVVDDGSSDTTCELLSSECRVKLVQRAHGGVSAARNDGIRQSSGDWIALLDSDDEWTVDKLAEQVRAIEENPESTICHTDELWFRGGKRVNPRFRHRKAGGWIFERCLPLCAISPSSVMLRRTVFEEIGLFDEDLPACEDYDLWLRVCSRFPVLYVDRPLTIKHGGRPDQLSATIEALDKYRIRALEKVITGGALSVDQEIAALDTLLEKIDIYRTGARKRGREAEVEELDELATRGRSRRRQLGTSAPSSFEADTHRSAH